MFRFTSRSVRRPALLTTAAVAGALVVASVSFASTAQAAQLGSSDSRVASIRVDDHGGLRATSPRVDDHPHAEDAASHRAAETTHRGGRADDAANRHGGRGHDDKPGHH